MDTKSNHTNTICFRNYVEKFIPIYTLIPLIYLLINSLVIYEGTMLLLKNRHHYNMTTALDGKIPVMSEWMFIYFGCYLFWMVNYTMVARIYCDRTEEFYRFITTDILARLICAFIFLIVPTTNVRPEIAVDSFSDRLLVFLYHIDKPENLFPSIHCMASWLCFAGIRHSSKVSLWYKVFSCLFALLVAASTQFTKQHYLVDIAGGFFVAEFAYQIGRHTQLYQFLQYFFDWLNMKIFGKQNIQGDEEKE